MKNYNINVMPGDGIGKEVVDAALIILNALPLNFKFIFSEIGYETYLKKGTNLPNETIENIKKTDATLFGAVTTPPEIKNYSSAIIKLRKLFDLYANVRPCKSIPHAISRQDVDLIIVRENTEDLYSGIERVENNGNKAITERIITREASEKIIKFGFELALKQNKKKITIVHKANVMRETCGLFRKVAFEIFEEYKKKFNEKNSEIIMDEMHVDACAMQLIKNPSQFQIIITTNLFGDILSDEASMLVGGLGIAYSGNIGLNKAIFEPVHGSNPKNAGLNKANPIAAILSAKMMLEYLNENFYAEIIEKAVYETIKENYTTYDLGNNKTTKEVAEKIKEKLMLLIKENQQ
ncbi:MAG: isocitrate/isopropylmalate dehydrogenase family protein [Candidatus Woesearchaeota archaeon]